MSRGIGEKGNELLRFRAATLRTIGAEGEELLELVNEQQDRPRLVSQVGGERGTKSGGVVLQTDGQFFDSARAVNQGLAGARGRYAILLNSDAFVEEGAVGALVRFMDENPSCGLAGGRVVDTDGTWIRSIHRFPSLATEGLSRSLLRRLPWTRPKGAEDKPYDVDGVSGAWMIARPSAARQIGVLDEEYFLFLEDVDWCYRMWRGGWRVCHVPAAKVRHLHGASRKGDSLHSGVEYLRSLGHYFRKHRAWASRTVLWGLCGTRVALDWALALARDLAALGRDEGLARRRGDAHRLLLWSLGLRREACGYRPVPWPPQAAFDEFPQGSFIRRHPTPAAGSLPAHALPGAAMGVAAGTTC